MGKAMRFLLMIGAAFGFTFGAMGVASAAECGSGYTCIWQNNDYGGDYNARSINSGDFSLNNAASSAGANGATCRTSRFYDGTGQSGSYFTLSSAQLVGSNYQDPNLSNGVGNDGAGINWDNRVSSYQFLNC
ncbi:hypothetical protein ACIG47_11355 [Promicromonospora sp. NPDC052451]|uniref:hypothetical protein n=1 Tax=Promicromonospora sp. NPDC052451 TaxID=3364407 RepID=UPI0037CAC5C0